MALIFTRRADYMLRCVVAATVSAVVLLIGFTWYYFTPKYSRVGYQPGQPVPYSHELHVGQLGFDCRYCHQAVTDSPHATIPSAETCMNCHHVIKPDSPALAPVREAYANQTPVKWRRIHKVPDFAYFNHAVHVRRGVSCVSCHGQVNEMTVVYQKEPLSMSWCLDCHQHPADKLRPNLASVTNLNEKLSDDPREDARLRQQRGRTLKESRNIQPPTNCQSCHR